MDESHTEILQCMQMTLLTQYRAVVISTTSAHNWLAALVEYGY